jgi:hypothetical protein
MDIVIKMKDNLELPLAQHSLWKDLPSELRLAVLGL